MELLRLNTTTSLSASFSGLSASSNYTLELDDLITSTSFSASATANTSGVATFTMPSHYLSYNGSLAASVKNNAGDVVNMTNIDVVRPYATPSVLASALSIKTSEAIEYEKLARYIIDSHTGGFTFIRKEKEFIGNGTDELMIDEPIYKLYKVYENGQLMYDYAAETNDVNYKINRQLNAVVVDLPEGTNRINYPKVWRDRFLDIDFFEGYEYILDADYGWKVIPEDIQEACSLLVQDIVEDNLRYVNKYIESFDNDDFKIKFSKNWTATTGNRVVDRILERYQKPIRVGVL
jgi:hypothetical protein